MAVYRGYVKVAHSTYDEWKSKTINNSYDVDFAFGFQCWDYVALLYWQYGLTLVTKVGGGSAKDCWLRSKNANAKSPFIAVEGVQNIKRGDIIGQGIIVPYTTTENDIPGSTRIGGMGSTSV